MQTTPCPTGVAQAIQECMQWSQCDEEYGMPPPMPAGVQTASTAVTVAAAGARNGGSQYETGNDSTMKRKHCDTAAQVTVGNAAGDNLNPSLYRKQLEQLSVEHRAQLRHEQQRSGTWVDPDIPPKPLMFPTLYEYLMVMRFEPSVGPPTPEFAWHRFHGWSREWYLLHKVPAGNETHMGTVCRLMREHPASKPGWLRLLAVKEAERESDKQVLTTKRPLRPPHAGLVQYLRGRRFNPPGFFHDKMHAEAWESFKAWGAEWCLDHPEEGLDEADMHNSLIEAMYMHKDGHRKWCAHACKQNVWPPTGDCLGDRPGDYGDRELE